MYFSKKNPFSALHYAGYYANATVADILLATDQPKEFQNEIGQ